MRINQEINSYATIPCLNQGKPVGFLSKFKTRGDGSCGLHAFLGNSNKETNCYEAPNIKELREAFANRIFQDLQSNKRNDLIQGQMEEYLLTPERIRELPVGEILKNEIVDDALKLRSELNNKKMYKEADSVLEVLINLPEYHDLYRNHLSRVGVNLTDSELGAAAVMHGKSLDLYKEIGGVAYLAQSFKGPRHSQKISIIDVGNHYEKAVLYESD